MHVPSELGNKMEDIEFAIAKKKRDADLRKVPCSAQKNMEMKCGLVG